MTIATTYLPPLAFGERRQVGVFTTDGAGDFTTTTSGTTAVAAGTMNLASSAGFKNDVITVPGGGVASANTALQVLGVDLLAANRLNIPNPGIGTLVASGVTITRWNRISFVGRARRIVVKRRDNGDILEWIEGMERYSLKKTLAGVYSLDTAFAVLVVPGAVHFGPGILANSATYDIEIFF